MKNKGTELVFILDKSGSMAGLEKDTIGGFNALIKKQKGNDGEALVTTVLFDHTYMLLHERLPIGSVKPLTDKEYIPGGTTALLDAVGRTIESLLETFSGLQKKDRSTVLFVIITDGEENASMDYTLGRVRNRIEFCKESEGWEFLYLGANIDAFAAASSIGISKERTTNYHADPKGVGVSFKALDNTISHLRCCERMDDNWKDTIEEDYKKRREE